MDFGDPTLMDGFFRWLATAYDLPQRQAIVVSLSGTFLCAPMHLCCLFMLIVHLMPLVLPQRQVIVVCVPGKFRACFY